LVLDSIDNDKQEVKTFKQTSDDPYIRHDYKVVFEDGKTVIFDNYEDAQLLWWNRSGNFLSHIEVLDKKKSKGFK
jgi:hypothetical protein